jgi:Peroxidase
MATIFFFRSLTQRFSHPNRIADPAMKLSNVALYALLSASAHAFAQQPAFASRNNKMASTTATSLNAVTVDDLTKARGLVDDLLDEKNCGPIMVRLAWHDSGTYDKNVKGEWPAAGGAIGSIRFKPEIQHGANAGLSNAIALLEPIKKAVPAVSYADLFQLASARAIEKAGGPTIPVRYVSMNGVHMRLFLGVAETESYRRTTRPHTSPPFD